MLCPAVEKEEKICTERQTYLSDLTDGNEDTQRHKAPDEMPIHWVDNKTER